MPSAVRRERLEPKNRRINKEYRRPRHSFLLAAEWRG
jgi:hypothetical protein